MTKDDLCRGLLSTALKGITLYVSAYPSPFCDREDGSADNLHHNKRSRVTPKSRLGITGSIIQWPAVSLGNLV